jgi:hypothetical protein
VRIQKHGKDGRSHGLLQLAAVLKVLTLSLLNL